MVIIAHRFGYGLEHGPVALLSTRVLGHRCDHTLCQRIGSGHVEASTPLQNRREWAAHRVLADNPMDDRRGARGRARALRDGVRAGRELFEKVEAVGRPPGRQMPLSEHPDV